MSEKEIRNERGYLPLYDIERSLQTKYRKDTWSKFIKGIKEYELVKPGDRIGVAISGGKDSIILAKLFQQLKEFVDYPLEVEYICMDPGYSPHVRKQIEELYDYLNIPVKIYDSDVFSVSEKLNKEKPCYMCARMRRGFLYGKAKDLSCNKLALGHHFDDVIETNVINFLWGATVQVMMPKLYADNFDGMELIRPLYLLREKDIIRWRDYAGINPILCACSFTERNEENGARKRAKEMIKEWSKEIPNVENSIFKMGENIRKNAILGYIDDGVKHSFLENYGENK